MGSLSNSVASTHIRHREEMRLPSRFQIPKGIDLVDPDSPLCTCSNVRNIGRTLMHIDLQTQLDAVLADAINYLPVFLLPDITNRDCSALWLVV